MRHTSTEIIRVPFHGTDLLTVELDAKPHIVLRPAVEAIGLDYSTQLTKLRGRSWAVVGQTPTTGSDGKTYQMVTVDVRTFLMLLATVDERRVANQVRPLLVAYQSEVAEAIEAYWASAETAIPAQRAPALPDMSTAEGQLAVIDLLREQVTQRAAAEAKVAELEPAATSWSVLASADGDYSVREAAYILNRDPGIDTGQRRLFALLREWRILDRRNTPYSEHASHVRLRARTYTYQVTGAEMPAEPQVRITASGLRYLHRRMGGTAALDTSGANTVEKVR